MNDKYLIDIIKILEEMRDLNKKMYLEIHEYISNKNPKGKKKKNK